MGALKRCLRRWIVNLARDCTVIRFTAIYKSKWWPDWSRKLFYLLDMIGLWIPGGSNKLISPGASTFTAIMPSTVRREAFKKDVLFFSLHVGLLRPKCQCQASANWLEYSFDNDIDFFSYWQSRNVTKIYKLSYCWHIMLAPTYLLST